MNTDLHNNLKDKCLNRHWCPQSEAFTGADSLLTMLHHGWDIALYEIDSSHRCRTQPINIYVFILRRWSEERTIQVIHNPFIERFVAELDATMIVDV